jgi:hypothetical protein
MKLYRCYYRVEPLARFTGWLVAVDDAKADGWVGPLLCRGPGVEITEADAEVLVRLRVAVRVS